MTRRALDTRPDSPASLALPTSTLGLRRRPSFSHWGAGGALSVPNAQRPPQRDGLDAVAGSVEWDL